MAWSRTARVVLLLVAGGAIALTPFLVTSCGSEPVSVDGSLPDVVKSDDALEEISDAGLDWKNPCTPTSPYAVLCPDGDYYITVNGVGPPKVFRWNDYNFNASPYPIGFYSGPGQGPAGITIYGSEHGGVRDGGLHIVVDPDLNGGPGGGCYGYDGVEYYCSALGDDAGDVTITYWGLPGMAVTGHYIVPMGNTKGDRVVLSGTFNVCRICDQPGTP